MDGRLDLRREIRNGTAGPLVLRPGKAPPGYIGTPYDNPEDAMLPTKNGVWWFTWSSHKEGACYRLDDARDEEGMLGSSLHARFVRDGWSWIGTMRYREWYERRYELVPK